MSEDVKCEDVKWLSDAELATWLRLAAVVELLPGVLDAQLRQDSQLNHFEYYVMAMLSEAPNRTLRMTALAQRANATLPRLSHVVARLESRGLIQRSSCLEDRRATNAQLTEEGWAALVAAAPGHVQNVRTHVIDALTPAQVGQLREITEALLARIDPEDSMTSFYGAGRT